MSSKFQRAYSDPMVPFRVFRLFASVAWDSLHLIVDKQSDSAISKRKFRTGEIMLDIKKILSMLGILALIFFVCGVLELSAVPKKHIIVIDPAHGGQDKGIALTDKVAEKDITLAVALAVRKELAKENNLEVVFNP